MENSRSQKALDDSYIGKVYPLETEEGLFQKYVEKDIMGHVCDYCKKSITRGGYMITSKTCKSHLKHLLELCGQSFEEIDPVKRYISVEGASAFKFCEKVYLGWHQERSFSDEFHKYQAEKRFETLDKDFIEMCDSALGVWLKKVHPYEKKKGGFVDKGQITGLSKLGIKDTVIFPRKILFGGSVHKELFYSFPWPTPHVLVALLYHSYDFHIGVAMESHGHGN